MVKLHSDHMGVNKTMAKQVVYWLCMFNNNKNVVMSSKSCSNYKKANIKKPLLARHLIKHPYFKLEKDFTEIAGHTYLLVTYYYSKCSELVKINSKSADTVIK